MQARTRSPRGRGQSLSQMALACTLRDPRVTSTLIGASSVAQLEQNVAALDNLAFSRDGRCDRPGLAPEGAAHIWAASSEH